MSKQKNRLKTIDSPVYRYWSALYLSFFSRRLYVDVGKRWKGLGVLYLFFAMALFSIPVYIHMSGEFSTNFKEQTIDLISKVPTLYIQNGTLIFDKQMPYKINDNKNQTIILIDTTGAVNDFTEEYPKLNILINKDKISIRTPLPEVYQLAQHGSQNRNKPVIQLFGKGTNLVFEGKQFIEKNGIQNLLYAAQIILYPMIVAIYCSIFIVFFFVLALLGQTFSGIFFSFKVSFAVSSRLLIVAGTPMLSVLMVILSLNKLFVGAGILLFALLTAYYAFGIYALKAESRRVVTS